MCVCVCRSVAVSVLPAAGLSGSGGSGRFARVLRVSVWESHAGALHRPHSPARRSEFIWTVEGFFFCIFRPAYAHHPFSAGFCLSGLCSLATVCCFLAGMDLLHRVSVLPDHVDGTLGWSLYLALIASPLHMMAAALLMWAARSHSQSYDRMTVYRVA